MGQQVRWELLRWQANPAQKPYRFGLCLFFRHLITKDQGFGNLSADRLQRIERAHGFLKNHADLFAADLSPPALIKG